MTERSIDGDDVGVREGEQVETIEGTLDGAAVTRVGGLRLGINVGAMLGLADDTIVGAMVGSPALGVGRYDG